MAGEIIDNEVFQAPQSVEPTLIPEGYQPPSPTPDLGISEMPPMPPAAEESIFSLKTIVFFILILVVIGGVVLYVINFLKKGQSTTGGPVELTYWGLWESVDVMQPIIEDYKRTHSNITIKYEVQSTTQYRERLQAAIQRGEGPDIFRFHNTWVPVLKNELAPVPTDVMSTDDFKKTFYPVTQNDLLLNGKFYGLPLYIDGLLLFYNKDLLTSAGYANPPVSWREFEDMAGKMTVKDGFGTIQTAGAAMGLSGNVEHFSDILGLIFYQNGANFKNLVAQPAIDALTYYALFAQKPNNIWDENQDNSIIAFSQGKVGFIFAPSWQVFNIKSKAPNLNFGVTKVPQLEGATPVSWATYWVEGVSSKSKHQKEAFAFLKYLSGKEVVSKLFTEETKGARIFGEPYARVDLASTLSDNEYLNPLLLQAPQMRSWYLCSRTFDNGLNDKIIKYFEDAVNSVAKGSSPRGALETAVQGVTQVLGQYGVK